jgi:hypothetical protein
MKTAILGTLTALALTFGTLHATSAEATTTVVTSAQKGDAQKGGTRKAGDAKAKPAPTGLTEDQAIIDAQLPSYPGNYCMVHGGRFEASRPAQNLVVGGQLYRVCSAKCASKVELDTANYYQRLRKAIIGAQKPNWPLETCPISGDAYGGDHGDAVDHVIGTRYVKLCCKGCVKQANSDPVKFLTELDAQMLPVLIKSYPVKTCVISNEDLGSMGDPIDFMYGHRAVRLCCKGCVKSFKKDPRKHMEALYPRKKGGEAAKAKPAKGEKKDAPKK